MIDCKKRMRSVEMVSVAKAKPTRLDKIKVLVTTQIGKSTWVNTKKILVSTPAVIAEIKVTRGRRPEHK